MIQFPDHVGKSLMFKIEEYEKIENEIGRNSSKIIKGRRRQVELLGEIKGMLQAEDYENEQRKSKDESET